MSDLASIRNEYARAKLNRESVDPDPIKQFDRWMNDAITAELRDPTAMVLSTVSIEGVPSSRIVLLKGLENGKFIFYTNYESKKGLNLRDNSNVAITFFWSELERQVNIIGKAEKVSTETSEKYFDSRPLKSKYGTWASKQSRELTSRGELIKKFMALSVKYLGRKVPRPDSWGGYKVSPNSIEFWQGRPNRLHDRLLYSRDDNDEWAIKRLYP